MIKKFKEIFEGLHIGYGLTKKTNGLSGNGKINVKHVWMEQPLTDNIIENHFSGKGSNLGIVPINKNNQCKWGCIDIDEYNFNHKEFVLKLRRNHIPLIVFRSTSGGAHMYLFSKTFVEASLMRNVLINLSASLGLAVRRDKIFPQQIKIDITRKDRGNFCSLPYYNYKSGLKYAFKDDGNAATLDEFYQLYDKYSVAGHLIKTIKFKLKEEAKAIKDGPPCLEVLCSEGFPEGTRNNGLYNIGVYLKKFTPDNWEKTLEDYNIKYMKPRLSNQEVENIKKSLRKKNYNFTCRDAPINAYCNRDLCLTKKHGIGNEISALPDISNLTKIDFKPSPTWFLSIDGNRLEIQTDDLMLQSRFQKACMEQLNLIIPRVTERQWTTLLRVLFATLTVIEPPESLKLHTQLTDFLEDFTTNRAQGKQREDLLRGVPYTNKEEDLCYFKWKDFWRYLERNKWQLEKNKTSIIIQDLFKVKESTLNIEGKRLTVWVIKAFEKRETKRTPTEYEEKNVF